MPARLVRLVLDRGICPLASYDWSLTEAYARSPRAIGPREEHVGGGPWTFSPRRELSKQALIYYKRMKEMASFYTPEANVEAGANHTRRASICL
eukprot:1181429-Prorocentrum_minimum.AAC.1